MIETGFQDSKYINFVENCRGMPEIFFQTRLSQEENFPDWPRLDWKRPRIRPQSTFLKFKKKWKKFDLRVLLVSKALLIESVFHCAKL